ncbi:hypothetical protein HPB50_025517 [Hyalomma asiaticum]|uniref:Uncharacterized protein n=1 Tax=Hyalomma asiaticum TaxID=266040 RepID=A0ACB7SQ44_HYAAI|nr:hypothetical protein HPB50_025517 [Hyalomma asiaticum]
MSAVNAVADNYVVVEQLATKPEFLKAHGQRQIATDLTLDLLADQEFPDFDECENGHDSTVKYPVCATSPPERTKEGTLKDMDEAHRTEVHVRGVKGPSSLLNFAGFDIVLDLIQRHPRETVASQPGRNNHQPALILFVDTATQ